MPDLPTEAEVAEMRERANGWGGTYEFRPQGVQDRDRLLALVEAWAPLIEGAAFGVRQDMDNMERRVHAEYRRWKGETT